jgi:hypothetical protein
MTIALQPWPKRERSESRKAWAEPAHTAARSNGRLQKDNKLKGEVE